MLINLETSRTGNAEFVCFPGDIHFASVAWLVDGKYTVLEWGDSTGELYTITIDEKTTQALNDEPTKK